MALKRGSSVQALKKYRDEKASKRTGFFWRPKDAESKVRILPSQDDDLFFVENAYHKLGDSYLDCLQYNDQRCPICEKVKDLYNGTESEIELAGVIRAKKQYYYNIIVRGDEYKKDKDGNPTKEPDIKIMQIGVKLHDVIINAMTDPEIGDITNVDEGFDLIIRRKMDGRFPDYTTSSVSRVATKLFDDESLIEYCLTHTKKPKQFIKYDSSEVLAKKFEQFMETGSCESSTPASSQSEAPKEENKPAETSTNTTQTQTTNTQTQPQTTTQPETTSQPTQTQESNSTESTSTGEIDKASWKKEFAEEFKDDL